jgi:very-short-patch-repair endonuclease/predicted transcriptional regulator of viral defense system
MDRKSVAHPQAEAITALAERQYGVIAVAQLYSLGLSETQVGTRVANGWLHRVHRGVYALGQRRLTSEAHWMAAALACGERAVLSHQAAAELWKLRRRRGNGTKPIDVTVRSPSSRGTRPGIVLHRVPTLLPGEATFHCRIPVTTPVRTILDLATVLPCRELERAVNEAERLKLCTEEDLNQIVGAHSGRAGAGALGALLCEHRAGSTATRNDFEELFLSLCRTQHLPLPEVNMPLLDYVVDFLWPGAKLVVEVDGRGSHATRRGFQEDRDRDGRLTVAGYRVVRFTWFDVTRRPAVVADRVRRLLTAS